MSHCLSDFFAVTEHKKQSEQKNEQVQKKRKNVFNQATHFGRQKSSHFFRSALCGIGKVHLLHGLRQMPFHPIKRLVRYRFIRRLQHHLRLRSGVDRLSGGEKQQQQGRNNEQQGNAKSAEQSRGIGPETFSDFLVKRKKENRKDRRPGQRHQKR